MNKARTTRWEGDYWHLELRARHPIPKESLSYHACTIWISLPSSNFATASSMGAFQTPPACLNALLKHTGCRPHCERVYPSHNCRFFRMTVCILKKKTNLVNKHRKCPTTQCNHLDQLLRTLNECAG